VKVVVPGRSNSECNNTKNTPSSSVQLNPSTSSPQLDRQRHITHYRGIYDDDEDDQEDEFEQEHEMVQSGPVTPVAGASPEVATMTAAQSSFTVSAKRKRLHDDNHDVPENSTGGAAVEATEDSLNFIHHSPRSLDSNQTISANPSSPKTGKSLVQQMLDKMCQISSELNASKQERTETKKAHEMANQQLDEQKIAFGNAKQKIIDEAKRILESYLAQIEDCTSAEMRELAKGLERFRATGARNIFCLADAIDEEELAWGGFVDADLQYEKSLKIVEANHKKLFEE